MHAGPCVHTAFGKHRLISALRQKFYLPDISFATQPPCTTAVGKQPTALRLLMPVEPVEKKLSDESCTVTNKRTGGVPYS